MRRARIDVNYEATLTIIQENIAIKIRDGLHLGWTCYPKDETPFKDWDEIDNCWYDNQSNVYIGILSHNSNNKQKGNAVYLHVCQNVPMWNLESKIKNLLEELGAVEPELILPNYVRAVAQGALRLLEYQ